MDTEELIEQYKRTLLHLEEISIRFTGTRSLYEASIMSKSTEEQLKYRNELHALLDSELDIIASHITLANMIKTI